MSHVECVIESEERYPVFSVKGVVAQDEFDPQPEGERRRIARELLERWRDVELDWLEMQKQIAGVEAGAFMLRTRIDQETPSYHVRRLAEEIAERTRFWKWILETERPEAGSPGPLGRRQER